MPDGESAIQITVATNELETETEELSVDNCEGMTTALQAASP